VESLKTELEEWGKYVEGDVHGAVVKDASGNVVASRGGLYGDDYAIEEAKAMLTAEVEHARREAAKERIERERAANQDVATV
jgi:hypothetical protein